MSYRTHAQVNEWDNIIDVRDVIARVEHLRQLRTPGAVDMGDDSETAQDELFAELSTLESLLDELAGNGRDEQWEGSWYPLSLIRDSYFKEYAIELADECGMVAGGAKWPNNHIDWDAAAEELKCDYSSVEFEGATFWYR